MSTYIAENEMNNNNNPAWECIKKARSQQRPQTRDYIRILTEDFFEVRGDRCLGDDPAMVTGVGCIQGRTFTIIGQQKGHTLKERMECNFGMPQPAGYRKSMRAIQQAEKFNRPILCLIDTPGAFCGVEAEEKGQGTVIAQHLQMIAAAKVPVIAIVIGEGGSGGALALALSDRLMMMENTYFSVISPEGCASILFKDASKAQLAAQSLRLSPQDLVKLDIADTIIEEEEDFSIDQMKGSVDRIKTMIDEYLVELDALNPDALVQARYERFLNTKGLTKWAYRRKLSV